MNRWQNSSVIERGEDEGEGRGPISRLIGFECIGTRVCSQGRTVYVAGEGNVRGTCTEIVERITFRRTSTRGRFPDNEFETVQTNPDPRSTLPAGRDD